MQFKSIDGQDQTSFKNALFNGVAPTGSLYVPAYIPKLPHGVLKKLSELTLTDIAFEILSRFVDDIPPEDLKKIIANTFHYKMPLYPLTNKIYLLELFHGPTLAFKDIGARFLAETLSFYLKKKPTPLNILVATSGDTGSAVAQGFYDVPGIQVYILYPKNKVSPLQEKQMTTLGGNIHAIEIAGTFDDCQGLVKKALIDPDLQQSACFSTANSINIGRLLPQIVYYFWGLACLLRQGIKDPTIIVPSGNFGNITAAAYAKAMGASIKKLIAATNSNDVIYQYLNTGTLSPKTSKATVSNAMDVGNPNNFIRLQALYQNDFKQLKNDIVCFSVSDKATLQEIVDTYNANKYLLDPHTAVAVRVAKMMASKEEASMVIGTAHPGKFSEIIQQALNLLPELPPTLRRLESAAIVKTSIPVDFALLKQILLAPV